MRLYIELGSILKQNAEILTSAAELLCSDKNYIYDVIYLATYQTKQKYKKLANKERAVEVCISLMKQPRKHMKHNFSSVEDCIEKALAAKIVPWKPIVSAVAVLLASTILVSSYLPGNSQPVAVGGFEMENTSSIANDF